MDIEQNKIQKILKRRKLEAATLESTKFRDALESCDKLPNFDCPEDYDYEYGNYYDYENDGTQDYEHLQY